MNNHKLAEKVEALTYDHIVKTEVKITCNEAKLLSDSLLAAIDESKRNVQVDNINIID